MALLLHFPISRMYRALSRSSVSSVSRPFSVEPAPTPFTTDDHKALDVTLPLLRLSWTRERQTERDRDRERQRQTETDRDREKQRQRDRDTEIERHTDRQRQRQTETERTRKLYFTRIVV